MFSWYRRAKQCYAFLADVPGDKPELIGQSLWFRRGWTLQELIAPSSVFFCRPELVPPRPQDLLPCQPTQSARSQCKRPKFSRAAIETHQSPYACLGGRKRVPGSVCGRSNVMGLSPKDHARGALGLLFNGSLRCQSPHNVRRRAGKGISETAARDHESDHGPEHLRVGLCDILVRQAGPPRRISSGVFLLWIR